MNGLAKVAVAGLGLGATSVGYRTVTTLADNKKGSLTNRADCAAEKIKNDSNAILKLGVPSAVVAGAAVAKPGLLSKIGQAGVKYLRKGATALGKLFKNPTNVVTKGISKVLNAIKRAPKKYGKIGLTIAVGAYVLNAITKHARNDGKIDQKYNDTGAIENATKNLVLNA